MFCMVRDFRVRPQPLPACSLGFSRAGGTLTLSPQTDAQWQPQMPCSDCAPVTLQQPEATKWIIPVSDRHKVFLGLFQLLAALRERIMLVAVQQLPLVGITSSSVLLLACMHHLCQQLSPLSKEE